MDERKEERRKHPAVLIVERRKQGKKELTSAEVLRVVKRRTKGERKYTDDDEPS